MTDRELLQAAARAAGRPAGRHIALGGLLMANDLYWNPLTDDGDALRLAVKLRMAIKHEHDASVMAGWLNAQPGAPTLDGLGPWYWKEWIYADHNGDPLSATRRAIVCAAAAMGGMS